MSASKHVSKSKSKEPAGDAKTARLNEELRENLKKRKQQGRARAAHKKEPAHKFKEPDCE